MQMCQQVWCVYIAQVWKFSALCSFGIWHNGTRVNLRPWIFLALFEKNCLFSFFAKVVPTSTMCVHSSSLKVFSSFFLWHLAQWNQSQFNTLLFLALFEINCLFYIAQVSKFSALSSFGIWHNGTRLNLRPWIFLALLEKNCLFSFLHRFQHLAQVS